MMAIEDDVQIYDSLFALMAKSDNKENDKVTLLDIRENLRYYSLKELRSLDTVFIDYIFELTKENDLLNKTLMNLKQNRLRLLNNYLSCKKATNPPLQKMNFE